MCDVYPVFWFVCGMFSYFFVLCFPVLSGLYVRVSLFLFVCDDFPVFWVMFSEFFEFSLFCVLCVMLILALCFVFDVSPVFFILCAIFSFFLFCV